MSIIHWERVGVTRHHLKAAMTGKPYVLYYFVSTPAKSPFVFGHGTFAIETQRLSITEVVPRDALGTTRTKRAFRVPATVAMLWCFLDRSAPINDADFVDLPRLSTGLVKLPQEGREVFQLFPIRFSPLRCFAATLHGD